MSTLHRSFDYFLDHPPTTPKLDKITPVYIKIDAKYFGDWCVIVFKVDQQIIYHDIFPGETYQTYSQVFQALTNLGYLIQGVTSDWHQGIVWVVRDHFPTIPHQRCLVHTQRFCLSKITRNPRTEAGWNLRELVLYLTQVKSVDEARVWKTWLWRWEKQYLTFINQKSSKIQDGVQETWYTHKYLRQAYRTLKSSLDHLFLYLEYLPLPRDTNGLEAEFTHLKTKTNLHRGLTYKRKTNFVKWYFFLKSTPKN